MARRMTALQRRYFAPRRRSTSVVRYARPTVIRVNTGGGTRRRSSRRRRSSGGFGSGMDTAMKIGGAALAVGFITAQPSVAAQLQKLPVIGNRTLTVGLAAMLVEKHAIRNKWLRYGSLALIGAGALQLGRQQAGGSAALEGFHGDGMETIDGDELAGDIDPDDIEA